MKVSGFEGSAPVPTTLFPGSYLIGQLATIPCRVTYWAESLSKPSEESPPPSQQPLWLPLAGVPPPGLIHWSRSRR